MREAGLELLKALERYGYPVSPAAEPALMDRGSREAQALHKATVAFRAALRSHSEQGGKDNG